MGRRSIGNMMKRLIAAALYVVAVTIGLSVLAVAVLAYFVTSSGPDQGTILDVLARS